MTSLAPQNPLPRIAETRTFDPGQESSRLRAEGVIQQASNALSELSLLVMTLSQANQTAFKRKIDDIQEGLGECRSLARLLDRRLYILTTPEADRKLRQDEVDNWNLYIETARKLETHQIKAAALEDVVTDLKARLNAAGAQGHREILANMVEVFSAKLETSKAEIASHQTNLKELTGKASALETQVKEMKAENAGLREASVRDKRRIAEQDARLSDQKRAHEKLEQEQREMEKKLGSSADEITQLRRRGWELQSELDASTEQLSSVNAQIQDLKGQIEAAQGEQKRLQGLHDQDGSEIGRLKSEMDSLVTGKQKLDEQLARLKDDMSYVELQRNDAEKNERKLSRENDRLNRKIELLQQSNAIDKQLAEAADGMWRDSEKANLELQQEIADVSALLQEKEGAETELRNSLQQAERAASEYKTRLIGQLKKGGEST